MTNTHRKHPMVTSPLLLSLCCLSPLSLHAISFQDILDQSQHTALLLTEKDTVPFNNPFTANVEPTSIPWQAIVVSFPILPENVTTLQQELQLSNVPIYLSYLEYILLREKHHQRAISLSTLPHLFYRNLPNNSSKVSVETALKSPLPLIRPIKEISQVEELLETSVVYPSDLNALESNTALHTSNFHYTPSIQQALSLNIDKQVLPSGKIHDIRTPSIKQTPSTLSSEVSFAQQMTSPSSEQPQGPQGLPLSNIHYPLLEETPVKLYEFTHKESFSPIERLVPAAEVSSADMVPLSHYYPHTPSLNLLFTSFVQPEPPRAHSPQKAMKEPSKDIPVQASPIPLATEATPCSPVVPFSPHSAEISLHQISHPPELTASHLPKQSHLKIPHMHDLALYLAEEKLRLEQHLSPSLEPYIAKDGHRAVFVPGIGEIYIGSQLGFTTRSSLTVPTYYVDPKAASLDKAYLRSDPYNSDAFISYITLHTQPHVHTTPVTQPIVGLFVPKKQDSTLTFPLSLTTASFVHLMDTSSISPMMLSISDYKNVDSTYSHSEFMADMLNHPFLRSDPYNSDAFISYITLHAQPHVHTTSVAQPVAHLVVPKKQDSALTFPLSLTAASFVHLMDTSSISPMTLSISDYKNVDSTYSRSEFMTHSLSDELLYNRTFSSDLMTSLEKITPNMEPLDVEFIMQGSVIPEMETAYIAKAIDYPFLQEFYSQLVSDINPFLISRDWNILALSTASLLTPDKTRYDNTAALEGALTLLESVGNKQMIDSTCIPNTELLVSIIPNQEAAHDPSLISAKTPDPIYFTVHSTPHHSSVKFSESQVLDEVKYMHTIGVDTEKGFLPITDSLLSLGLESLQQEYMHPVLSDVNPHETKTPHSETSNFLAYSKLCEATLNHYSLSTEHYSTQTISKTPKLLADIHLSPELVSSKVDLSPSRKNAALLNQSSRNTQENLAQLPTLQDLRTLSLSEEFSVDLQVSPNSKGSGYLFSITLEPTLKNLATGSAQNFIFLVDRSSSIDKNRLQIFKQAVTKALPYLKDEDTFNILSFDTEISKMSHESVSVSPSTKHGARRFLESQKRGYKYVLPNLYSILMQVHAMVKESPLPTTVVLLTNGKSLENFNVQDERLAQLISTNKSGFTLFTACSSQNNNTLMLEILSNLNRGEFMHSQTNAAFPRKLAAFVKHAGSLIAKDIHVSAAQTDPNLKIEFFPDTSLAPNLYGDRPYTIIGKIDTLSDFDLVLQGRFCDNWLNVTKKISFKTARHGGHSIYKDYTMHMAYNKYREFLQEGNTASLDEAKKVLQPFNTLSY